MPKRKIVVLQNDAKWNQYLTEVFEDTSSKLTVTQSVEERLPLIRQGNPDVVFANPNLLTKQVVAALQANRASNPQFRAFSLGNASTVGYPFDGAFDSTPPSLHDFQKHLTARIPLPDPLRILLVDDDPEVGELFQDYFDHRTGPSFLVEIVQDVKQATQRMEQFSPHVFILDLRWPEGEGRELYRRLRSHPLQIPFLILTDLISSDEVIELRQLGNPAIVEKKSRSGSMPALAALIKKLAYFG